MLQRRALIVALAAFAATLQALAQDSAYALGLRFTDDAGRVQDLAQWQGAPVVLTMAYGACRRVCSTTLLRLQQLQVVAARGGEAPRIVVVGLDPEELPRDWADYRRQHALPATWSLLSGDAASVRALAHFLGLRYWRYDEHVMHDFLIVRLDAQGHVDRRLRWSDDEVEALLR
jgi:cytochrome oxidase Cu insertion factor (SCO1/SenC/PrrC family)